MFKCFWKRLPGYGFLNISVSFSVCLGYWNIVVSGYDFFFHSQNCSKHWERGIHLHTHTHKERNRERERKRYTFIYNRLKRGKVQLMNFKFCRGNKERFYFTSSLEVVEIDAISSHFSEWCPLPILFCPLQFYFSLRKLALSFYFHLLLLLQLYYRPTFLSFLNCTPSPELERNLWWLTL